VGMTQHALRSKDNKRFAPRTASLATQHVKILRGARWLANLNVVFACQLQEAFDAGAGMFRALAFKAVREKQDYTGRKIPFVLTGADELIDDDLRAVHEIAELRFPQDQSFRIVAAKTVFEAEATG